MSVAELDVALDRPLPQSPDAERAVLGSILINNAAMDRVALLVDTEDFFRDAHRTIFATMKRLAESVKEIDPLTLRERLSASAQLEQVGGSAYVASLVDKIPDIANVERYAQIVREKADLRRLIVIGNKLMRAALDTDGVPAAEIAAAAAEETQMVRPNDLRGVVLDLGEVVGRLAAVYRIGGVERGASTAWPSLDEHYTVAPGAWTLITGIPGHGKSGFLDHLVLNLAKKHDWQAVMFSAENFPPESHLASLLEKFLGEPFNEGPTARMQQPAMERGLMFVNQHFRFIDPAAERMTVDRILATATALAEKRQVNVLTIDPWNELHHDRAKGITETEYISVCLTKVRRWARKHRAHVFVVAHPQKMEKDRNSGQYGVPTPYDVSGSAHWRNKADYCLTVYRDITNGDDPNVQIHVQKVRRREMGRLGVVTLHYDKVTSEYRDPTRPRGRWEDRHENT